MMIILIFTAKTRRRKEICEPLASPRLGGENPKKFANPLRLRALAVKKQRNLRTLCVSAP